MSKYTIYHNARCSKSRCALDLLSDQETEVIEYLKTPLTKEELKHLLKLLGIKAEGLVRKNEPIFKEAYADKKLTEAQWIKAMLQHPQLIERPIVVKNGKAIIARPAELISTLD